MNSPLVRDTSVPPTHRRPLAALAGCAASTTPCSNRVRNRPSARSRPTSRARAGVSRIRSSAASPSGWSPASGLAEAPAMPPDLVVVHRRGPVALLTLNRPEKLNALDYPLIDRLMAELD